MHIVMYTWWVLAHLRRRWRLSGRDGVETLSAGFGVFFGSVLHCFCALDAAFEGIGRWSSVRCVVQKQRGGGVCTGTSGGSRGLSTGRWLDTVHRPMHDDVSAWQGRVITGHWGASDRPPSGCSGARFSSLEPYWSRPDAGPVAFGENERCVRCGVYASAVSF
jgi:hypothetical protein